MAVVFSLRNARSFDPLCPLSMYRFTRVDPADGLDIDTPCALCLEPVVCVEEVLDVVAAVAAVWAGADPVALDFTTRDPSVPSAVGRVICFDDNDELSQEWTLEPAVQSYVSGTITATLHVYRGSTAGTVTFTAQLWNGSSWLSAQNISWANGVAGWSTAVLASGLSPGHVSSAMLRMTSPVIADTHEFDAIYVVLSSCPD